MDFVSIRLITNDIKRLVGFYEQVTSINATWYSEDFAELVTPTGTLALASQRTMALFAEGAARAADNHSVIIELRVGDVDACFEKLKTFIGDPLQVPTTMPWGNRSLLFRDPDGNLVNFFTPVTPAAIKKHSRQS